MSESSPESTTVLSGDAATEFKRWLAETGVEAVPVSGTAEIVINGSRTEIVRF